MVAAAGGRVILVVPKVLRRLLTTLDGVAAVLSEEDDPLPPFDYHCPLLSLPFAFGTTMATIPAPVPYLRADPSPWAGFLGELAGPESRPGLGGQIAHRATARRGDRQAPLDAPGRHGAAVVGSRMQLRVAATRAAGGADAGAAGGSGAARRIQPDERQWNEFNWADTADLIAGLDLVIAVDTAVAHLAGALGKPVWMLNRFDSCWRWLLNRDDTPWYPSMRQFRQTSRGDWAGVIERVRDALLLWSSRRV